jgi:hypothetical protein
MHIPHLMYSLFSKIPREKFFPKPKNHRVNRERGDSEIPRGGGGGGAGKGGRLPWRIKGKAGPGKADPLTMKQAMPCVNEMD